MKCNTVLEQSEYISYFKYLLCAASDGPALYDVSTCVNISLSYISIIEVFIQSDGLKPAKRRGYYRWFTDDIFYTRKNII